MDSLNQMELQDIRHNVMACTGFCQKLDYYQTITNDATAKDVMTRICKACTNLKSDLTNEL